VWQQTAYGGNAIYDHGHHGNAILPPPHPVPGQPGRLRPPLREPRPAPLRGQGRRHRAPGALRVRAPGPHRRQPPPPDGRHRRPPRQLAPTARR
jgi:hypothetical protein